MAKSTATKPKVIEARHGFDGDPPTLRLVRDIDDKNKARQIYVAERRDRLDTLHSRRIISDYQFAAGLKLAKDWEAAEIIPCPAMGAGGFTAAKAAGELSDARLDALQRYGHAMASIQKGGPLADPKDSGRALPEPRIVASAIFYLVIENQKLTDIMRRLRLRNATAGGIARAGLHQLARHYRFCD